MKGLRVVVPVHAGVAGAFHSCGECPLWDDRWTSCAVSGARDTSTNSDGSYSDLAPDWCPLRQGAVVVQLAKVAR